MKGVLRTTNGILHLWTQSQLEEILAALPERRTDVGPLENRRRWDRWQEA